ncbi:MAG: hypothetical protein MUE59_06195 [Thiobacillaceae bacterium]|jgi:hypothetical protein|nr:hypothetical protein [Thiobacillaceae bacterium]
MARVLLDDLTPGLRTIVDGDEDGNLYLRHEEDVTHLIEHNARVRSVIGRDITRDHDRPRWVARLSGVALHDAMLQGLISEGADGWHVIDQRRFRRWLNNRDVRGWRTSEGNV